MNTFNEFTKENLNEGRMFMRLPKKAIGNDLYEASKRTKELYDSVKKGRNFSMTDLEIIEDLLDNVKQSAKSFTSKDDVPDEYM